MKKAGLLLAVLLAGAAFYHFYSPPGANRSSLDTVPNRMGPAAIYPDPARTPGATNPEITQENIFETICNPAWSTRSIRPPASYTGHLKREQILQFGYSDPNPEDYEEDHLIPLELGGHPTDPANLWPEAYSPTPGAREKDKVENYLHRQVCEGKIPLGEAQKMIAGDWYRVYEQAHLQ